MADAPSAKPALDPERVFVDGSAFRCEDDELMAKNRLHAFAMADLATVLRQRNASLSSGMVGLDTPALLRQTADGPLPSS